MNSLNIDRASIAIVHDVIDKYGGAERVVEALLQAFPKADLYTSRATNNMHTQKLRDRLTGTSFMQKLPWIPVLAKVYTPLYPLAFESLDLSAYEIVISSTAHFAKGVITSPDQLHVCYCHTPPRFLYGYPSENGLRKSILGRLLLSPLDHYLREYDYISAQRPDVFIANSQTVAKRILKFYKRRSIVIYPPVKTSDTYEDYESQKGDYFLTVSRLVPYKNIHTIIDAFSSRTEKLVVVGDGPELSKLMNLSHQNTTFKTFVSEPELASLYANARAFVFAASDEDFGIAPIEAMSYGVPVIALKSGGVSETVTSSTGIFFEENTAQSLQNALDTFTKIEDRFDKKSIKDYSQKFGLDKFTTQIRAEVGSAFTKISSQ